MKTVDDNTGLMEICQLTVVLPFCLCCFQDVSSFRLVVVTCRRQDLELFLGRIKFRLTTLCLLSLNNNNQHIRRWRVNNQHILEVEG